MPKGIMIYCFVYGLVHFRYTAIVASTTLLLVTGVTSPFSPDFYTFSALRFVMGMTFYSFCFLFHVLGKYRNSELFNIHNFEMFSISYGERKYALEELGN